MNDRHLQDHLSAEQLQALLEGELAESERAFSEEHLSRCARCSSEMEGWRTLFEGIQDLPVLAPQAGFVERVMHGVNVPQPLSLAARVRVRLTSGWEARGHPSGERLQDFVEGTLAARGATRVQLHLEGCATCAGEAQAWRTMLGRLDALDRFSPAEHFADQVMAGVHVPEHAVAQAPVADWRRALAWAGGFVPRSQQAWAAISGVAVTPVATLGLLIWTLFTHPTLTVGSMAAFAWWKVSEMAVVAWQAVASTALESTGVFGVYSLIGSVAQSPAALAGVFLTLSAGTVGATWVLYRNLIVNHPADGQVAHVSMS